MLYFICMKKQTNTDITIDPKVKFGKPVIAGTRVPVDLVVGKIAGGMEMEKVEKEYNLTHKQILTAFRYAAELIASEEVHIA